MVGGTELLSYALLLFLIFIYLPYTLFTLFAERFIDLGRRRDSTQLEEIVSAFMPSLFFNGLTFVIFGSTVKLLHLRWPFDWAVVAAIFGKDRGAISDYIYGGKLVAPFIYVMVLWGVAVGFGYWFGWAALALCKLKQALEGVEHLSARDLPPGAPKWRVKWGWVPWKWLFHESFVPLFTWRAQSPIVRVETTDRCFYWGTFIDYEKATGGRTDAIHLKDVTRQPRCDARKGKDENKLVPVAISHVYLKWSRVAEMHIFEKKDLKTISEALPPPPASLLRSFDPQVGIKAAQQQAHS